MNILSGKKILITGMKNKNSLAFGIAKEMEKQGATLAFTYFSNFSKKKN